jgi:hypothetical protein
MDVRGAGRRGLRRPVSIAELMTDADRLMYANMRAHHRQRG